jgi:hypothetical protein
VKTLFLAAILSLAPGVSQAQGIGLYDAIISDRSSIEDPAKAVTSTSSPWLAFTIPAVEGTRSPCCWSGSWKGDQRVGCELGSRQRSFGSGDFSPLVDTLVVYARVSSGQIDSIEIVGDQCPMDARGQALDWIGSVSTKDGLDWLENQVRNPGRKSASHQALHALALHAGTDPGKRLFEMAKGDDPDLARDAIFWLGESRGNKGYRHLDRLLKDLPKGSTRRQINFALAENDSDDAANLLVRLAQRDADRKQRTDALFWLAQSYPDRARSTLKDLFDSETDKHVLREAVFAVSQLRETEATKMLLDLAAGNYPREVRREALFWLAQSDDNEALDALTQLLSR